MSIINEKNHLGIQMEELTTIDLNLDTKDLEKIMKNILSEKVHGFSFSAYEEGQSPLDESQLNEEQLRNRIKIIEPYTEWIRTFSCTSGNELSPKIAKSMGLKTMVGAWICDDLEKNEEELESLIEIAKNGHADIVAVGNEVLLREEMSVEGLIDYIKRIKEEVPGVEVGYVDAYYIFDENPALVDACDVILANCYPFWECCQLEYAVDYMKQMYEKAVRAGRGKKVIISETGWPNEGSENRGAKPSYENAMKYFINTYQWAKNESVDVMYFSSFDEDWKVHHEGDCGAYWGLWDKKGNYKFGGKA